MLQNATELYRLCLLTRRFEERVLKLIKEGLVPPTLHPGAGQEVSQLAALGALRNDDPVLYGHRGVAYMLGRGIPLTAILADMAGREGGTNNGKGGVMHTVDIQRGIWGESGTLGGGFVIATGMGMALKKKRRDQVVVHFFGDGTANRGTFHESLNWSAVQKLPIVFICENNGWAVSVPVAKSTSIEKISDRAPGYGIPGITVDGSSADAVHDAVSAAAKRAREGNGPSLIEIKSVRLLGHFAGDPQDYRPDASTVHIQDPMNRLRDQLIAAGGTTQATLDGLEQEIAAVIEAAVKTVRGAASLRVDEAFTDLYA